MSQSEDMDAINKYMRTKPIEPGNAEAFQIKDSFIRWWDNLGWYDKSFSAGTYDEARTRRNQFNIANAKPGPDREHVRNVIATGIETEEMQGKPRPKVDAATGRVGTQVKKPTVQATPSTQPKPGSPSTLTAQGSAPVPFTRILRQGTTDGGKGDVKTWQTFLGIIPPTGNFGPLTVDKTKAFQRKVGLNPDGAVGELTWNKAFPPKATVSPTGNEFAPEPIQPKAEELFAATPKPATKPAAKPAPKPAAQSSAVATTKTEKAKEKAKETVAAVKQAGVFDVGGWPLWAKVGGIMAVVAAAVASATGKIKPIRIGT
jgi:peptidoglycan hydrolase-like protein with peptidoglycan-binding domain